MKKVIKKNTRRPFPWFNFPMPIFLRKGHSYSISKHYLFTDSAIYHFEDDDQYDVNKLFGFSCGYHHNTSFRFGWRPNKDLTKMEIVGYEYFNGVCTQVIPVCEVMLNIPYNYTLTYDGTLNEVIYDIKGVYPNNVYAYAKRSIVLKHNFNIGYKLYLYFGGNKKAPHDIIIYQNNL